jgi:hypothetical protein
MEADIQHSQLGYTDHVWHDQNCRLPCDEGGKFSLIAGDIDGYDVPPDWYMQIAGYGSSLVKGERNNDD